MNSPYDSAPTRYYPEDHTVEGSPDDWKDVYAESIAMPPSHNNNATSNAYAWYMRYVAENQYEDRD